MTFLASKNHSRKMVLVQTLSCNIKLPRWCNNVWGNYFPSQLTMWGCSLSTKGHMNFQAKTVVPDQTCTLLWSSDLGRHIPHKFSTTAVVVTVQAAQNGGQETKICDCTAQRVSPVIVKWALTHLLLNLHLPRNWTQCEGRAVDSLQLCPPIPTTSNLAA